VSALRLPCRGSVGSRVAHAGTADVLDVTSDAVKKRSQAIMLDFA
jgi:hypothetical protein